MKREERQTVELPGIDPACYQHAFDRVTLRKMEKMPVLPLVSGAVIDFVTHHTEYMYSGNAFVINEVSQPDVYGAYVAACRALDVPRPYPSLYALPESDINAFTTGVDRPIVCANRALLNSYTNDELKFIFGHELGHYLCGHVKYHNIARWLTQGATSVVKSKFVGILWPTLMSWSRYSELSADRAGLLACQDFDVACSALLKLGGQPALRGTKPTGSPSKALEAQAAAFRGTMGEFSLLRRLYHDCEHVLGSTHPRLIERYEWLREWIDMGCFEELMDASPSERREIAQALSKDSAHHDLTLGLVMLSADCLTAELKVERKVVLPLLRSAYLSGKSLVGTPLERLVMVELGVSRVESDKMRYSLELYINDPSIQKVKKVTVEVPSDDDWSHAPAEFREKMLRSRTSEIKVGIYS